MTKIERTGLCVHWPGLSRQRGKILLSLYAKPGHIPITPLPIPQKMLKLSPSQWVRTSSSSKCESLPRRLSPMWYTERVRGRALGVHAFLGEQLQQHCMSYIPLLLWAVHTELTWECAVFTLNTHPSSKITSVWTSPLESCHLSFSYVSLLVRLWCLHKNHIKGQLAQDSILYLDWKVELY